MDLKRLLLNSLISDLLLEHVVTLLELGIIMRFLNFSFNSDANLHGLQTDLVLFNLACVLTKLLKSDSHRLAHRVHFLFHQVDSV